MATLGMPQVETLFGGLEYIGLRVEALDTSYDASLSIFDTQYL